MYNKQGKRNFVIAALEARQSLYKILMAYDQISSYENEMTAEKYPFEYSFDEWICEYDTWIESLSNKFFPEKSEFRPTITVKHLKQILVALEDDTQIVVRDEKNDNWLNIRTIELPDEDEGMFTLTFHTVDDFDNRQF